MMVQCKPLEMESIVPSKRRLSADKWQRSWGIQFKEGIPSVQNLSIFSNSFFEDKGFNLEIKVKSLKVATFIFEFESIELEDEIEMIFNFLTLLDSQFLKIERVEDRLFNQWDVSSLTHK